MQKFFTSGRLLKQWNHLIIALVPKSKNASYIHNYRPISCCTVFYDIISKVLVDRLRIMIGALLMVLKQHSFKVVLLWIMSTLLKSFSGNMPVNKAHHVAFLKWTHKNLKTRLVENS